MDIGERKFPREKTKEVRLTGEHHRTEASVGGAECTKGRAVGGKESVQIPFRFWKDDGAFPQDNQEFDEGGIYKGQQS